MGDLLSLFRTAVRQLFGPELKQFGFVDSGDRVMGVDYSRFDLEIRFFYEGEPQFSMGILFRPTSGAMTLLDLERIAWKSGTDVRKWCLPQWVNKAEEMYPALAAWKRAFFDLSAPLLAGDLSLFWQPIPAAIVEAEKRQPLIEKLYWDAYGAWKDRDFPKLIRLFEQLENLGYKLSDEQKKRLETAKSNLSN